MSNRKQDRVGASWAVQVRAPGRTAVMIDAQIRDLTSSGCRMRGAQKLMLSVGDMVSILLETVMPAYEITRDRRVVPHLAPIPQSAALSGNVCWCESGEMGIEFDARSSREAASFLEGYIAEVKAGREPGRAGQSTI